MQEYDGIRVTVTTKHNDKNALTTLPRQQLITSCNFHNGICLRQRAISICEITMGIAYPGFLQPCHSQVPGHNRSGFSPTRFTAE